MCLPNKVITIRPLDPPWIRTSIKRHIRERNRAYKKGKTNQSSDTLDQILKLTQRDVVYSLYHDITIWARNYNASLKLRKT